MRFSGIQQIATFVSFVSSWLYDFVFRATPEICLNS
jgi:hypothetical protein